MKNLILTALFLSAIFFSNAQLKVDVTGRIGMGTTNPNSGYKCDIRGNLLLSSYPENPFHELQLKVGQSYWPGARIGSTSDIIALFTDQTSYNHLYLSGYSIVSDSTHKRNILPLVNNLYKLLALKVYSYDFLSQGPSMVNGMNPIRRNYGFLSQQVEEALPEVDVTMDDQMGTKLMDPNQILPVAVGAIQEQQKMIDSLSAEIERLKNEMNSLGNSGIIGEGKTVLHQNQPNPFNERTVIRFDIQENDVQNASLLIFDMNGLLIKDFEIIDGQKEIIINGRELKAGMYIYTLVVNNKEVSTKKMILRK